MNLLRSRLGHMGLGSLQLLASSALAAVLGYGFWFLLARTTDQSVVGEASAVVAAASLVSVAVVAGLVPSIGVGLAREPHHPALLSSALALAATTTSALALLVLLGSSFLAALSPLHDNPTTSLAFVSAAAALALGFTLDAAHTAKRRVHYVLIRNAATASIRIAVLPVLLLVSDLSTSTTLALWSAALWAGLVPSFAASRHNLRDRPSSTAAGQLLASFGWNHLGAVAGQAPTLLLPVLVTASLGAETNAWFYMGWQLAAGCHMVSAAVAPVLLSEHARGHDGAVRKAARLALALGTAAALATLALGPFVIKTLGPAYASSLGVLLVMVLAAAPDAVTGLAVARWRAEHRERLAACLNLAMAATTVSLALLALPTLGAIGAAWAFLAAQTAGALFVLLANRNLVPWLSPVPVSHHVAK
jgi:O-antigen/teichoic acid export membrane protein